MFMRDVLGLAQSDVCEGLRGAAAQCVYCTSLCWVIWCMHDRLCASWHRWMRACGLGQKADLLEAHALLAPVEWYSSSQQHMPL